MYQVTIKGRNLDELKKAVSDINEELGNGVKVVKGMERNIQEIITEAEDSVLTQPLTETMIEAPAGDPTILPMQGKVDMELDSNNLPWDKRIHAATKTQTANGAWKYKRGIDQSLKDQVEAELRESMHRLANPTPIPAAPVSDTTPVVEQPVVTPVVEQSAPVVEQPVVTPVTPAPTPQPVTGGHTVQTFSDPERFPMIIAGLISEGKLTQDYVNQLLDYFKVNALWRLNEVQKAEMFETFAAHGIITKVG